VKITEPLVCKNHATSQYYDVPFCFTGDSIEIQIHLTEKTAC